ncbi:DUF1257 domain-containing protein [Actinomadura sp. CNU-125]|uniref:DUF1257 domain-containing protein n=1 Tax=Actinomadura sp. CNU-125 TaxID=1904961 RepID=UPI00291648FD|nr:DUF1257 domain-containing protein [Actinomadura sp. CNU-125]
MALVPHAPLRLPRRQASGEGGGGVRRQHIGSASNDLGFHRTGNGTFEAIISGFDRRKYDAGWLNKVSQRYGRLTAVAFAEDNGFDIAAEETDRRTGEVRLTLRRTTV